MRFLRVLHWEWRLATSERSYGMTLAILSGLTLLADLAGVSWAAERRGVIDSTRAREAENLRFMRSAFSDEADLETIAGRRLSASERTQAKTLRVIAKLPTSLAYFGSNWSALLRPSFLAPLAIGHSDLWPDRFAITAWSKRTNLEREDVVNPFHLATGPFDPSTLVVAILPLVLIVLTHDMISADRERGILALTLSQPTPYSQVVLARLVTRVVVPSALVIGVSALGLVIAGGANRFAAGPAVRFVLWSALVLLYGAFWGGLALMVNALGNSSGANAILLVVFWVGTVIVGPAAVVKGAALASPVPPRSELITVERAIRAEAEKNGQELLDRYYRDHPTLVRPDRKADPHGQTRWDAIALEVDRRMQPEFDRFRGRFEGQFHFSARWQPLAPALAVKSAMNDLAGTSLEHHLEFTARAEDYHSAFMDDLRPMMMTRHELSRPEFDRLPRYDDHGLADAIHAATIARGFGVLGAWSMVFYLTSILRLRRAIAVS